MGCAPLRPTSSRRAVCTHQPHAPSLLAGQTPLHWASAAGAQAAVQELIQTGSSTAARNIAGLTPLHWASGFGCKQAARDLLGAGSERGVKDIKGRTPADLAASIGDPARRPALLRELLGEKEASARLIQERARAHRPAPPVLPSTGHDG